MMAKDLKPSSIFAGFSGRVLLLAVTGLLAAVAVPEESINHAQIKTVGVTVVTGMFGNFKL
ncbi:MAG: hypothetical protein FJ392_06465 [Verrucomicrobia bacterium]|nr:hypothetical protein [Verrucomicrobiota bacterium]